jgi:DNA repair protein RecN (Recombination protein N)
LIASAAHSLHEVAALDPKLGSIANSLEDAVYSLDEAGRDLRRYSDSIEADPARLEAVEDRIAIINRLRRKYGETIADILGFGEQARRELESLTHSEERLQALESQESIVRNEIGCLSLALSEARQQAASHLASAVLTELAELAMGKARFAVEVTQEPDTEGVDIGDGRRVRFDNGGVDDVEFLIAPNPGEPLLPLAKIASGGELARVMLALKTVLAEADATPILVFDEVDSGVGGRSGDVMGRKLWSLGQSHQVLCVTHLPQVAVYADAHYRVAKETAGSDDGVERTVTTVRRLAPEERAREISAMLGGSASGQYTHLSAQELLQQAARWKDNRSRLQPAPSPE